MSTSALERTVVGWHRSPLELRSAAMLAPASETSVRSGASSFLTREFRPLTTRIPRAPLSRTSIALDRTLE